MFRNVQTESVAACLRTAVLLSFPVPPIRAIPEVANEPYNKAVSSGKLL